VQYSEKMCLHFCIERSVYEYSIIFVLLFTLFILRVPVCFREKLLFFLGIFAHKVPGIRRIVSKYTSDVLFVSEVVTNS